MPQLLKPATKITVVPKDGELEITLNINITVDGQLTATTENGDVVSMQQVKEEEKTPHLIPDFFSGVKLNFGK